MKKINKKHLIFFLILLILPISFLFTKDNNFITNIINKQEKNDPTDEDEPEVDNWEISTVFYDSTVDNGNTPITEIDWDASDGGYQEGESRVITIQLTIKNTNVVNSYNPHEVKITLPNLFYGEVYRPSAGRNDSIRVGDYSQFLASSQIRVSANDKDHSGYDWDFVTGDTPLARQEYLVFSNSKIIESKTNFEDTIRIEFTVTPSAEYKYVEYYSAYEKIEYGEDECLHEYNHDIKAKLEYSEDDSTDLESNELKLHYKRLYTHPWEKKEYTVEKKSDKITSYDGLGSNPDDYIWVQYTFLTTGFTNPGYADQTYPYFEVPYADAYIKDTLPEGCVAYDGDGKLIEPEDNAYKVNIKFARHDVYYTSSYGYYGIMYVGYPKNTYNEDNLNLNITNKAELWGKYYNQEEDELLAEDTTNLNLADYIYENNGDNYKIVKTRYYNETANMTNVDIENNWGSFTEWKIATDTTYNGQKYDLIIGDDKLLYELSTGEIREMSDDEYYFYSVSLNYELYNSNGNLIPKDKYDIELWIRKKGETEYTLKKEFKNGNSGYQYFSESEGVVAYYYKIKDLEEGVHPPKPYYSNYVSNSQTKWKLQNITETGTIYNYAYVKIYINDNLVNSKTIEDYSTYKGKDLLAEYDLNTHGGYIQRSVCTDTWKKFVAPQPVNSIYSTKGASTKIIQDAENEKFIGNYYIGPVFEHFYNYNSNYNEYYSEDYGIHGYDVYDLLPSGMILESTAEDIKNSVAMSNYDAGVYSQDVVLYDTSFDHQYTPNEITTLMKNNTTVEIKENWNNTGRTWIHIRTRLDSPVFGFKRSGGMGFLSVLYEIKYSVSYDSVLEYGKVWTNRDYVYNIPENIKINRGGYSVTTAYDDAMPDPEANDINEDGIRDPIVSSRASATITSIFATHQAVTTQVKTDQSNFNTGKVLSSKNSEYEYKLKVTTGTADVTNLVIYNSLEDYAKNPDLEIVKASGGKQQWKGELLGIDTSYAEAKGYKVKVYYNENPNPGTLAEDDTWQEYTDETDKTKVKAFAFKYLNEEGTANAVLPANSLTYVLIKMKSPNQDLKTFTYNGCWTEWNAIDPLTERPVDFITGINSNIVKVALPTSVEPEDMNITVEKEWKDNNNSLGLRPIQVTYRLIANNDIANAVEVPVTGEGNNWSATLEVPKYDNGGELNEYSIRENAITLSDSYKYVPTIDGFKITNTLSKEITLTKIWKDNTDAYLTRPSSITFKVKQNGNDYNTYTFGGNLTDNEWTKVITVPVFGEDGNEYTYTIEEVSVDNYSTSCENFTCTNTLVGEDTITVKKVWIDSDNEYNHRPTSIDIKLKQNGNDYQTITLTGDTNTWESDNITVPKYDSNGVKYSYLIEETSIDEYGLVEYNQSEYTVTNTLKKNISITVTKKWLDGSNELGLRPNELKINLLRNNSQYQELTLTGDTDTWTTTIEVPKYDDDQKEYTYSIKELSDSLNEDYSDITYSEEDLSVTNKLKKNITIKISKIWDDSDNELLTRPENLNINLLRNGDLYKELTLTPEDISNNTWEIEVEDLDVYDDNGAKYTYTIEENLIDQLNRYETITYDQTNYTITNKLTVPPKVTLFFTVKNGYLEPGSDEIKYDEEGLNNVLGMHNLNGEDEYIFNFELENVDTGEVIKGKLSTQGTLEFDDVPYGTYRAREGEDQYFDFVSMIEIEAVLGVSFTPDSRGGTITISPTGQDIVYGAHVTNKIEYVLENPNTKSGNKIIYVIITAIISMCLLIYLKKKKLI